MMGFQEIVKRVSSDFLQEAQQSPQLLADMAHMEYYMAESYSNRILIELLQNADDAMSSKFLVTYENGNIYVANNGKPFDEHDIVAISRSGASQKERGTTIGYRGIGFKSASALSNEITIYSSDTAFTFSKRKCAQLLGVPEENIPTVRVPLFIDRLRDDIKSYVDSLQDNGYSTIFIFHNANIELLTNEIEELEPGSFLFLRNIQEYKILLDKYDIAYQIQRVSISGGKDIKIKTSDSEESWIIYEKNLVSAAFLTDAGVIIPCEKAEAVYHCYLPTLEPSFISCKINADFSTDPSRKNIALDEKSYQALEQVAELLFSISKNILHASEPNKFKNFFSMLNERNRFPQINSILDEKFNSLVCDRKWITLNNGDEISPTQYKMFPRVMDLPQEQLFRYPESVISRQSVDSRIYQAVDSIDEFLESYSTASFDIKEIIESMSDKKFVMNINEENYVQLFAQLIREVKVQSLLKPDIDLDSGIKNILVKTDADDWITINEMFNTGKQINAYMGREIKERLSASENEWFASTFGNILGYQEKSEESKTIKNESAIKTDGSTSFATGEMYKWRSAEQKCVQIEEFSGNQAKDVSIKNLGYDVYSVTKDGRKRYIEVKSVKNDFSFSLTNNEYTAAYEYGEEYFICLMYETEHELIIKYIQDPLRNASFEKRVRQWDWVCLKYVSDEVTYELS